jgi:two-component system, chemotaxis family, response regulator WspF
MRIGITNDDPLAVEALRQVVLVSGEHEVAWVAYDGAQAVQFCARNAPDLILMDLFMPRLNGVAATRQIMARTPCAILVVTTEVADNAAEVFEAMGAGALDAVNTPDLSFRNLATAGQTLLIKIDTIRRLLGLGTGRGTSSAPRAGRLLPSLSCGTLVALGASAGGPSALATVLSDLPHDFPHPVVIVQHIDDQFAAELARWLGSQTALPVRLAAEGDLIRPGRVFLAGGDRHLVFIGPSRLGYTSMPEDCLYRPSVDVFFKSLNRFWPGDIVAVLLTGMGRDGAEGLRAIRRAGHHTIAQDQATSAVYGMPRTAVEQDAATEILALDKIGPRLAMIGAQKTATHV